MLTFWLDVALSKVRPVITAAIARRVPFCSLIEAIFGGEEMGRSPLEGRRGFQNREFRHSISMSLVGGL